MNDLNHLDESVLNEYLDSMLDAPHSAAVQSHLAECQTCSKRLDELGGLFTELTSLPELPISRDLSTDVLNSIHSKAQNISTIPPKPTVRLVILAQALIATLTTILVWPFTAQKPLISEMTAYPTRLQEVLILTIQQAADLFHDQISFASSLLEKGRIIPQQPIHLPFGLLEIAICLSGACLAWLAGNALLLRPARTIITGGSNE